MYTNTGLDSSQHCLNKVCHQAIWPLTAAPFIVIYKKKNLKFCPNNH